IHGWDMDMSKPLSPDNFRRVLDEAADIEVLLVCTGTELRRLPEEFKLARKSRGISSDPMSTGAAVRTFNIMLAEQR
ncbi:MTH938/NDUFAF3 family protein, partial [Rhizobium ruizarguesonis]